MPERTSPLHVILGYFVLAFLIGLVPYGLLAILTGANGVGFFALVALGVTLGFNFVMWLGHRLFGAAFYGDDEDYQRFREEGGDVWFHSNNPFASQIVPISSGEQSLEGWTCTKCGAPAPDLEVPCHACGFGQWHCGLCDAVLDDRFSPCTACGNAPFDE